MPIKTILLGIAVTFLGALIIAGPLGMMFHSLRWIQWPSWLFLWIPLGTMSLVVFHGFRRHRRYFGKWPALSDWSDLIA